MHFSSMDIPASSSYVFITTSILIIILKSLPTSLGLPTDEFGICSQTFNCGNMTGLSYPFYGLDRPQYCGHPGFELLGCNQSVEHIQLMILSQKFYVLGIDLTSSTMNVSREDFFDKTGCPSTLANITIDFSIFQYTTSDTNITLFYDECASKCRTYPCPMGGGKSLPICFMTQKMKLQNNMSDVTCHNNLFLPVHMSDNIFMDEEQGFMPSASRHGFELKWTANTFQCQKCLSSGGQCGHDSKSNKFICFCPDSNKCPGPNIKKKRRKLEIMLLACFLTTGMCMVLILVLYIKRKCSSNKGGLEVSRRKRKVDIEAFLRSHGSSGSKRYTYTDLKKMTNSFKNKLGEGGYGTVYKGQLQNGNLVAVKMLHKCKGEAEDFINEVASIGNTNHVNVVKLYGFCYEGQRGALVYEFMANGSLEKFLQMDTNHHSLGWETLFDIAIGVARGLEYLHRGCNTRILHFDIKPHNILLDDNFCPKISDFGLAKSYPQKESIISMSTTRGTIGYIAPEEYLKSFGGVSYKSDVYSYGMMVLEMVGCRRRADVAGQISSEQYFPQWIYERLEAGEGNMSDWETEVLRKMIVVSLWCVKTSPSRRPTMSKVVEMLQGTIDSLQIPRASSLSGSLTSQQQIHTLRSGANPGFQIRGCEISETAKSR